MKLILLCLSLFLCLSVSAEIYKWIDDNGNVVYSDTPQPGAEQINPPDINTIKLPKYVPKEPVEEEVPEQHGYDQLTIILPTNDATIYDNSGGLKLLLDIKPELQTENGHTVSILIDNKNKLNNATSESVAVTGINRGKHTAQAEIKDASGKAIITSTAITFHMRGTANNQSKAANKDSPGPKDSNGNPFTPGPSDANGNPIKPGPQGVPFKPGPVFPSPAP